MSWPAPNPPQPSNHQTTVYKVVNLTLFFGPPMIMTWHIWQLGVIWWVGFGWLIHQQVTRR